MSGFLIHLKLVLTFINFNLISQHQMIEKHFYKILYFVIKYLTRYIKVFCASKIIRSLKYWTITHDNVWNLITPTLQLREKAFPLQLYGSCMSITHPYKYHGVKININIIRVGHLLHYISLCFWCQGATVTDKEDCKTNN